MNALFLITFLWQVDFCFELWYPFLPHNIANCKDVLLDQHKSLKQLVTRLFPLIVLIYFDTVSVVLSVTDID